ncbi:molybdopterin synthase catalytic subunit [Paenibacillus sp. UNCCL117]|uniref:molybdenum cofactor biosynthesis protein MoaE n=1 Tax=unclassified Paenibacillus TaxID=185978 RepID=UPI0008814A77|nr:MULTISPECIES: molybdenum cofactor biosynthesis protein MoaE [unclassified Paenibacillus]SDC07200.1 molybdopterin synthase catalytic subunit [Paenibacillus sp. cl123]SFW37987.1 molybdopterin synthase catalytic subunit [Paenibacillus sp. UNCCL117]
MKLNILLFAGLAELWGTRLLQLDIERNPDLGPLTAAELKAILSRQYPDSAEAIANAYMAINQQYADDRAPIRENDEIALIPPVSGGEPEMTELTSQPIIPDEVTRKVLHPDHGAALTFTGTTREWTHGKRTVLLEYEAYEPMALRTLTQIADEIGGRWPGALCAITHRLGEVAIGEISVVIAVSAPHRQDVYEASRYAIERLKQIVPIWKKERWSDGSEWKGHQQGPWNPLSEPSTPSQGGDLP